MGTEEAFTIKYDPIVIREDLPALDAFWANAVRDAITKKLTIRPHIFGKPLRESLVGWRSLRVSDYRIVYEIKSRTVYVLGILHRTEVYKEIMKRLGML